MLKVLYPLISFLMVTSIAFSGGVAPDEEPAQERVTPVKVTATPAQTSAAINQARKAVVTPVKKATNQSRPAKAKPSPLKEITRTTTKPQATGSAVKNSWLLSSREGECAPLTSVRDKVTSVGSFKTPQEFAKKMQQRGYQAFALDIGEVRNQVVRVKVPDLDVDLTFVKAGMCR